MLGPILFSIYVNKLCEDVSTAIYNFYVDDTIIYCCSSSVVQDFDFLQSSFDAVQSSLLKLKLVLSSDKTKLMLFSTVSELPSNRPNIFTVKGKVIELVPR